VNVEERGNKQSQVEMITRVGEYSIGTMGVIVRESEKSSVERMMQKSDNGAGTVSPRP